MATHQEEAAREMAALLAKGLRREDPLEVDGRRLSPESVVSILRPYLTDERAARIEAVLDGRTYTVVPVVEGIINTGNVSAVMRSAEALGYQAFHIITGPERFKTSKRTTQGADKWLDVHTWRTPADAVAYLKAAGYAVVATHLDDTAVPIDAFDFTQKTALVFGNERDGVSEELLTLADRRCVIPTPGFVESFNISVAAAVSLYHAYRDRLARQGRHGDLTDAERARLRAQFYVRAVRHARELLRQALAETP
ncbi:MAG: tRNA (guanosine(18)-2'-O)-methyltransferase [Rhodothermaceae bacterium]|nr:MAG: tRNA (guanosine(18)-2'-O)-methyltransferase [Rhodothermaceae bacterium]